MIKAWIAKSKSKSKGYFYNCISGPDRFKVTGTGIFYFCSMVWYYVRPIPRFLSEVDGGWKWIFFVISVILTLVCCQSFIKASFSDPGILPRGPGWDTQDQLSPFRLPPVTLPVKVINENHKLRFCETCFMYRPPKTVHCSICNNCVSEFDHHCPWLGNCVGRRNYKDFLTFVFMTVVNLIYMAIITITFLVLHGLGYKDDSSSSSSSDDGVTSFEVFKRLIRGFPDFFVLAFLLLGFSVPVIMLCGLHIKLISLHKTTNEEIK